MDTPQRVTIFIQRQESSSSMIMIWNLICCIYKGEMHGLLLNIMFALAVQINACVRVVYTEVVQTKLKDKWKWKRRPKRQLNVCSWSSLSQTEFSTQPVLKTCVLPLSSAAETCDCRRDWYYTRLQSWHPWFAMLIVRFPLFITV